MKLLIALSAPILVFTMSGATANSTNYRDQFESQNNPLRLELNDRHFAPAGYRRYPAESRSYRYNRAPRSNRHRRAPQSQQYRHDSHSSDEFRGDSRAQLPSRIKPPGERLFVFSPRLRAWAAYLPDGTRVGYGRANGGSHWCAEIGRPCRTPRGFFRIRSKGSAGCKSSKYPLPRGGAPMPYCMFFLSSYAIHGSPYISNNNSSHGCIRVQNKAAYWLSHYFMKIGTKVLVVSY